MASWDNWFEPEARFKESSRMSLLEAKSVVNMLNLEVEKIRELLADDQLQNIKNFLVGLQAISFRLLSYAKQLLYLLGPKYGNLELFRVGANFGDIVMRSVGNTSRHFRDYQISGKRTLSHPSEVAAFMSPKAGLYLLFQIFLRLRLLLSLYQQQNLEELLEDYPLFLRGGGRRVSTLDDLQLLIEDALTRSYIDPSVEIRYQMNLTFREDVPLAFISFKDTISMGTIENAIVKLAETRRNFIEDNIMKSAEVYQGLEITRHVLRPYKVRILYSIDEAGRFLWELQKKREEILNDSNQRDLVGRHYLMSL